MTLPPGFPCFCSVLYLVFACWKILDIWNLSPESKIKIVLGASDGRICSTYYIHITKCILKYRINCLLCTCVPQALHSHPGSLLLLKATTSDISVTASIGSQHVQNMTFYISVMWDNVGKMQKESFTVQWLFFHTVNLGTENQARAALLGILCMSIAGKHTLVWSDPSQ